MPQAEQASLPLPPGDAQPAAAAQVPEIVCCGRKQFRWTCAFCGPFTQSRLFPEPGPFGRDWR